MQPHVTPAAAPRRADLSPWPKHDLAYTFVFDLSMEAMPPDHQAMLSLDLIDLIQTILFDPHIDHQVHGFGL